MSPEVQLAIEIRAAEIAAAFEDEEQRRLRADNSEPVEVLGSQYEADGWMDWENQEEWPSDFEGDEYATWQWQAGWLAQEIVRSWGRE